MPSPLVAFFTRFPTLAYTQSSHPSAAFEKLRSSRRLWKPLYGTDKRRLTQAYRDALTQEFNQLFGTAVDDLRVWQHLCRRVGVEAPPSVKECRQLISRTHVNLVDLIDAEWNDGHVKVFGTVRKLSDYTKRKNKIFPRKNIHAGDLLKYLLRHIANPSQDDGRGEGGKRHGRGREANNMNQ